MRRSGSSSGRATNPQMCGRGMARCTGRAAIDRDQGRAARRGESAREPSHPPTRSGISFRRPCCSGMMERGSARWSVCAGGGCAMSESGSLICPYVRLRCEMCVWPALGLSSPTALSRGESSVHEGCRAADSRASRARGCVGDVLTPGHTVDTYPDLCVRIRDLGHEFGHHGYFHESPISSRGISGTCSPRAWPQTPRPGPWPGRSSGRLSLAARRSLFPNTTRLLVEYGFAYDSSMMAQDYELYRCARRGCPRRDRAFEFGGEVDLFWRFPQFRGDSSDFLDSS